MNGKSNELGYRRINFNAALLAVPSIITGPATISCTTAQTYSIPAIAGASYQWIVPSGIQIVSGQGTRSAALKEYQGGTSTKRPITLRVTQGNCVKNFVLNVNSSFPEVATGIDVVDAIPSQLCTGKRYMLEANFTNTTGITSYDWVLPAGWRGPNNTNAFTTTSFITNITTSSSSVSGTIQVRARNSCGLGEPFQLNVTSIRCTD